MLARIKPVLEYGIALAVLYFAWWYASVPMAMPKYLLPSPGDTLNALWQMALENKLQPHLYYTSQNIVIGLLIGSVVGIALAYLLYRLPRLSAILDGPLVVFQTAPKIALAPLFVVWFGLGLGSKLILIFSLVFFPVLLGALAGFRSIDSRMNDLSKLLELNTVERFFKIDFMAALPGIFVGLKIGAVQALVGAILAEWISGQQGLGFLMTLATATYKTPLLFGAVLLTSLFGIALHVGITAIEHFALSWKAQDDR